ncbi:hypothetical protein LshimejAT787_0101430 [Lyophyllum shimeji]|uniref:Uncharacterized protein n=1 Tax=Lyophyllum shimeji TaxID=47721 RepID=A0A9P3PCS6_LYOSH|nr:hypothetical protein LshimejAT787_0101430 [Lyophyllum shimeji]
MCTRCRTGDSIIVLDPRRPRRTIKDTLIQASLRTDWEALFDLHTVREQGSLQRRILGGSRTSYKYHPALGPE